MCFDDVQQPIALFLAFFAAQCNFQRQVEVILGYCALLDQLIAAFGDLLIGLFQRISDHLISDCDRGYKFLRWIRYPCKSIANLLVLNN